MSIANTVKQYLDSRHIAYELIKTPAFESPYQAASLANISPQELFYPIVLRDNYGLLMAVLPATHKVDYARLALLLHRSFELALTNQLSGVFTDCHPGQIPPLGEAYGIRTIIDAAISVPDEVYVVSGTNTQLIKLARKDFMLLQANAWLSNGFSVPVEQLDFEEAEHDTLRNNLRDRIQQISELPPMSETAQRIFELRADPKADVEDLVKVVELDPSLTAQILRYANSPYYGYGGEVKNLQTAIARVLGFDMVMNLALGLALLQPIRMPAYGPIGQTRFWKHSVFSASLMQMLSKAMPSETRPAPATCYLLGLLHDFGYLVLGHLFKDAFLGLTNLIMDEHESRWLAIEQDYLGTDHCELGYWLMKEWDLPDELIYSAHHHHEEDYKGEHAQLVHMCYLTDYLLSHHMVGDPEYADIPTEILGELGLSKEQVVDIMLELIEQDENLELIAQKLAA